MRRLCVVHTKEEFTRLAMEGRPPMSSCSSKPDVPPTATDAPPTKRPDSVGSSPGSSHVSRNTSIGSDMEYGRGLDDCRWKQERNAVRPQLNHSSSGLFRKCHDPSCYHVEARLFSDPGRIVTGTLGMGLTPYEVGDGVSSLVFLSAASSRVNDTDGLLLNDAFIHDQLGEIHSILPRSAHRHRERGVDDPFPFHAPLCNHMNRDNPKWKTCG